MIASMRRTCISARLSIFAEIPLEPSNIYALLDRDSIIPAVASSSSRKGYPAAKRDHRARA
jgi:hypothetical protein